MNTHKDKGEEIKMNYRKMLEDINNLVDTDFCAEMEMKTLPKSGSYTQMEAEEMSKLLAKVYSISHCLYCQSCRRKLK